MSLQEQSYSILLVSGSEHFSSAFFGLLPEPSRYNLCTVSSISAARRAAAERTFDFVIINAPLPDDPGIRFAIDTCASRETIVLLLAKSDFYLEIQEKLRLHGAFALPKPLAKPTLLMALSWMETARERLRQFEKKTLSIEEKMAEIRTVNRAKWLLISELHMSEPEAHRYIEKQAMDRCCSKRSMAEDIIKTYS